ncbi:MAG: hypothetical protein KDD04_02145, partial [Sinomicrobium sp.]|nr:hypothetical protein [Sinomicrobium sp.]
VPFLLYQYIHSSLRSVILTGQYILVQTASENNNNLKRSDKAINKMKKDNPLKELMHNGLSLLFLQQNNCAP